METSDQLTSMSAIKEYLESFILQKNARIKFAEIQNNLLSGQYDYESEIFNFIDKEVMKEESDFLQKIPNDFILYRAREINMDDFYKRAKGIKFDLCKNLNISGYDEVNSREAPIGVPGEGRNNIKGMSYLYLADTQETACAEIKSSLRSLISLATFKTKHEMKIVDFSRDVSFRPDLSKKYGMSFGIFFTLLMSSFMKPDKNLYKMTQIISDYIRRFGVDGIAYKSFYTMGTNYTIFNSNKANIEFCGSKIMLYAYSNEYFWDFSEKRSIETISEGIGKYDDEIAKKMISDLVSTKESQKINQDS